MATAFENIRIRCTRCTFLLVLFSSNRDWTRLAFESNRRASQFSFGKQEADLIHQDANSRASVGRRLASHDNKLITIDKSSGKCIFQLTSGRMACAISLSFKLERTKGTGYLLAASFETDACLLSSFYRDNISWQLYWISSKNLGIVSVILIAKIAFVRRMFLICSTSLFFSCILSFIRSNKIIINIVINRSNNRSFHFCISIIETYPFSNS